MRFPVSAEGADYPSPGQSAPSVGRPDALGRSATTKGWRDCCPPKTRTLQGARLWAVFPPKGVSRPQGGKNRDSRALAAAINRAGLVHDYLGIDLERTWEITQGDLPDLKEAIVSLLEEMSDLS